MTKLLQFFLGHLAWPGCVDPAAGLGNKCCLGL